jgi:hypothetical protein
VENRELGSPIPDESSWKNITDEEIQLCTPLLEAKTNGIGLTTARLQLDEFYSSVISSEDNFRQKMGLAVGRMMDMVKEGRAVCEPVRSGITCDCFEDH